MKTEHPQPVDPGERRRELNRKLRAAFIEGAEEDWLSRLGRGLTAKELERVMRRYPGDVPERESVGAAPRPGATHFVP